MNVLALIPLLAVLAYGTLFTLALRNPRRSERRAFTLYLVSAGLWSFLSFLLRLDYPFLQQYTLTGSKVLILSFTWMALAYYHFVQVFVQKPPGREIYLGSGFILIFAVLAGLGELPRDAYSANGILYIDNGPALYPYTLFIGGLSVAATVLLVQYRKRVTTALARTRISYLLGGLAMLSIGGLTNLNDTLVKYPADHVGNLLNAAIISYAILRYRLLDISLVIRRGLAYSLISIAVTAVYLLLLFAAQAVFRSWSAYSSVVVAAGLALAMAVAFAPLRNIAQERVDRLFFRTTYEYRRMLAGFRSNLSSVLDLERLADAILEPLVLALRAKWAALLLPDVDSGDFRARFARRDTPLEESIELRLIRDSPLLTRLAQETEVIHADLIDVLPEARGLWEEEREQLAVSGVKLLCPLVSRGKLTGVLALSSKQSGRAYSDEELDLFLTMASGAAVALDNAQIMDGLRQQQRRAEQLLAQVVTAQEQERERVAIELHDSVAQWLVQASYQTQVAGALLTQGNGAEVQAEIASVERTVDGSLKELRRVLSGLRPPALDELGLTHALRQEAESLKASGIACRFETEGNPIRLPSSVEIAIYRIVQEALNNVRKHANASHVMLRLDYWEDYLHIEVKDDGRGFDVALTLESAIAEQHMGLLGIKQRVEWLDGVFKVESSQDAGTTIAVRLPATSSA